LTFSSSPKSIVTCPPLASRPNKSSSASALRIVSWISRAHRPRTHLRIEAFFFARNSFNRA
jgi:hypothetical protein